MTFVGPGAAVSPPRHARYPAARGHRSAGVDDHDRPTASIGHSQAALFGELSVARFHNVDAYLHVGFDTLVTPLLLTGFAKNLASCQIHPLPAGNKPGNPTGYGFRGDTDAELEQANFVDIDDAIVRHLAAIRPPDPCGFLDSESVLPASAQLQSAGFVGSRDKKVVILPGAVHTPMLERVGAPEFQKAVSDWRTAHEYRRHGAPTRRSAISRSHPPRSAS